MPELQVECRNVGWETLEYFKDFIIARNQSKGFQMMQVQNFLVVDASFLLRVFDRMQIAQIKLTTSGIIARISEMSRADISPPSSDIMNVLSFGPNFRMMFLIFSISAGIEFLRQPRISTSSFPMFFSIFMIS